MVAMAESGQLIFAALLDPLDRTWSKIYIELANIDGYRLPVFDSVFFQTFIFLSFQLSSFPLATNSLPFETRTIAQWIVYAIIS